VGASFLLAQISDSHIGATWADGDPAAGLAATIEELRRLPDRPDAILISGDLADNAAEAEYGVVRQLLARIDVPTYVLPGNHDDRDTMRGSFELPGSDGEPIQYAADLGPLRLVVLDSTRPGEDPGELGRERLAWLEAQLATDPDRPTIVAMHHPPLVTGSSAWDEIGLPSSDRAALAEIVARHPRVLRIVGGHLHQTIAAELGRRAVLAVPSTYAQARLDLSSDEISFVQAPPAFAMHVLMDGELTSHVQPVARSDRDLG
jgi:3',5'-cyclic-AMP phosphodiesterase